MSPRELQVAKLVCEGFVNGDIARRLGLKPGTVKTHLRSIFGKTRARNKISMLLRFMAVVSEDSGPRVQSQDGEKMLRGFVQF
jgi:DNA-binding NarL/FixJ family response regulator